MLNRLLFVFLFAGLFSATLVAQSKHETAVTAAVEALRKAMVDGDKTMLENLTVDGLSYGHSSGKIEDRASFVENIVNGNSDFTSIQLTDQTIFISGKTAIVRHKFSAATNDKGKSPGTVNLSIMTVWQKYGKAWKMLARQAVRLA